MIRLNPDDVRAYFLRGTTHCKKDAYDKSIADFHQALTINCKDVEARNGLAWLLATCPDKKVRDGKKAVENAIKAYQLTEGKNWACLDTLAAAYAESGDFAKAKEWETKAVEMIAADKSAKDKADATTRAGTLQAGKAVPRSA